jgi:hypothetical protein
VITGNGRLIRCNEPGCVADWAVPPALLGEPDDVKRRKLEGNEKDWAVDLEKKLDWCPKHRPRRG